MSWFGQSKEMIQMFIDDRSNFNTREIQNYVKFKSCSADPDDIVKLIRVELRAGLMRIMIPRVEDEKTSNENDRLN